MSNPDLRRAWAKKLTISDGCRVRNYTAHELSDLLHISRQHAYRIISNPDSLTPLMRDLLIYKDLRALPGWSPGWYVDMSGLLNPMGKVLTENELNHVGQMRQYISSLERQIKDLKSENSLLQYHFDTVSDQLELANKQLCDFHNCQAS